MAVSVGVGISGKACGIAGLWIGRLERWNEEDFDHEIREIHEKKDCAMSDMIYSDEVYAIQGAVFEVYKTC